MYNERGALSTRRKSHTAQHMPQSTVPEILLQSWLCTQYALAEIPTKRNPPKRPHTCGRTVSEVGPAQQLADT